MNQPDQAHSEASNPLPDSLFLSACRHSSLAKLICASDGSPVFANPAFNAMLGYDPEVLPGSFKALCLSEDSDREGALQAGLSQGQSYRIEQTLIRGDGSLMPASLTVTALQTDGSLGWILREIEDLTPLKALELQLAHLQSQFALAQTLARAGEWSLDFASGTLTWSEALFRLLRLDPGNYVPDCEGSLNFLEVQDRARLREHIRQAQLQGNGFDTLVRPLEGPNSELRLQAELSLDSDGRALGLAGLCIDHSDTQQLARQQLTASASLSKLNARLRDLYSIVTSTLDETLSRLSSLSQHSSGTLALLDEVVSREIEQLDDISDELRDSLVMASLRRKVSLSASLRRARRLLESSLERQQVRIEADFSAWDSFDYVPACLDQIMLHLLEQALRGGIEGWPEIRLRSLYAEDQRLLEVEHLGRAARPEAAPSTNLTRALLEACGGRLVATPGPGERQTLTVWF